jgi:hypothetical protein
MRNFAQIISIVFQPLFLPLYGIILLLNLPIYQYYYTIGQKLFILFGVALFTAIVPALVILCLIKTKKVKDYFIDDKAERTIPYIICFFCYLLCAVFLWMVNLNLWIVRVMLGVSISLICMIMINFSWKISAHMSGMGGFCGAVFAGALLVNANPVGLFVCVILLSGIVASCRIYLKAHTLAQTFAGFCLGFCCTFFPALLW